MRASGSGERKGAGGPDSETEQITGAASEGAGLDPPTEERTRVEPPTDRQAHARETEAIERGRPRFEPPAPTAPSPGSGKPTRWWIAIVLAAAIGLIGGIVAVVAINEDGGGGTSAGPEPASSPAVDPVASLRRHFDLLEQGRFIAASDDLTPALLDSLGGRAIWISGRIADLMVSADLDAEVVSQTADQATVRVGSLRTESLVGGCTAFSGSYTMVPAGEIWLIDSADLVEIPC